ncbi:MAG: arsenic resistance protein [Thiohalospira sp.]
MRDTMERRQAWVYLLAILAGMAIGWAVPEATARWEVLLWPVLGALLYATFTQVPLVHLAAAFRDGRFLTALLLGNFLVVPGVVGALLFLVPESPAIRLGVLLVLLVPCTDWFISFTHLGRGEARRAIAAAPILLLGQLLMLPLYIWLFMGELALELPIGGHLLPAFLGLIVVPLVLAWLTERIAEKRRPLQRFVDGLGWLPVPLLAIVVFLIAASQVSLVLELGGVLWSVVGVYLLYLLAAALVGKLLSSSFALEAPAARTVVFSLGTRNSFVVLPLALSLPEAWSAAVVVIVLQSLVELFGMVAYLNWVPRHLIRDPV